MSLTAAQRQKRYRENRKLADNGFRQINTWISTEAYEALRRMARRDGVTQRELIERLLIDAQDMVMRRLTDDELSTYLSLSND
jgi:DNA-binding MarR family transcriptional regulator